MKKYLVIGVFLFVSFVSDAQVFVGGIDINQADSIQIIEVYVDRRSMRKGVDAYVDFGQKDNSLALAIGGRSDGQRITDPGTETKKFFKSTGAVLNFLEKNGWSNYGNAIVNNGNFYYFRRKTK